MSDTIRWFIGTSCNNEDLEAQAVCAYSAIKHSSLPIDITWMRQTKDKSSPFRGWNSASWRTPFSGYRWAPPAICNYEGRSIYTDLDFFVLGDMAELWREPMPDSVVLLAKSVGKTCCVLFDNARAKGHIPDLNTLRAMKDAQGEMTNYFKRHKELVGKFTTGDWNVIDGGGYSDLSDPRVKAVHHSRMEHQCHLPIAMARLKKEGGRHWYTGPVGPHPRPDVQKAFDDLLAEATANGFGPETFRVDPAGNFVKRDFTYSHSRVRS